MGRNACTGQARSPTKEESQMTQPTFRLAELDAVTWLRSLPDASVDLAVTDPPYESLEKHRAVGTTTKTRPRVSGESLVRYPAGARARAAS